MNLLLTLSVILKTKASILALLYRLYYFHFLAGCINKVCRRLDRLYLCRGDFQLLQGKWVIKAYFLS